MSENYDHADHNHAAHDHAAHHADHDHQAPHGEQAWDERYRANPEIWSGSPNAVLVTEATDLQPGTALEAGAGEGGDACWLAARGWEVTAADISSVAIERAAKRASERGLVISWLHADLAKDMAPSTYDLVTAHFLHVPKAEQQPLFRHLAAAVAPGGTLLVVGHDLSDMARLPRPDLVEYGWTADEVVAALGEGWTIEAAEARPRQTANPDGNPDSDQVTSHDAVLRARRD
jgi:2-polyprenyl-3-methyl-5-hydroxy-6-metoxy-1,4-benzoquinol methylase